MTLLKIIYGYQVKKSFNEADNALEILQKTLQQLSEKSEALE